MDVAARVRLLAAQAFALGLALAWTTIAATTTFLDAFGSQLLPVTYLVAAAAGAAASVLLGRATGRRPLAQVAVRVFAGAAVVLLVSWALLGPGGIDLLSFLLVTLLPIALPIGFMFVVGQAGQLLDVRAMKQRYPRVIGAFALGFALGGLGGAPLLSVLGGTDRLLVVAAAAVVALLALVLATLRRFPTELAAIEAVEEDLGDVDVRSLLRDRFILLLTAYQMLSAVESQLLDYLVYDRAASRYPDPDELAAFVGRFTAIAYGADILFLLLVAGLLLRRWGLRLGLVANPTVVLTVVVAVLVATAAQGGGATLVFVLTVAARASDLTLSDGTTRTSVSAAYQAIPPGRRLDAQALVESMAVPIAIGISGAVLLVVQATVGTDGWALFVVAGAVLATWVACAARTYGHYRRNLLDNLRHRRLVPGDLTGEPLALETIDRLLDASSEREVRLGIAALEAAATDAGPRLRTAGERRGPAHRAVLDALLATDGAAAVELAREDLAHPDPTVRGAALDVLAQAGDGTDADRAIGLLDDPDPAVRRALGELLGRHGDAEARSELVRAVERQAASADPTERGLAGATACAAAPWVAAVHPTAARLLEDPEASVRAAGLEVVDLDAVPDLEAAVVPDLARPDTVAAAVAALERSGSTGVAVAASILVSWRDVPARSTAAAVRALRRSPHPGADDALAAHLDHPDRDLGLLVRRALAARRSPDAPEDPRLRALVDAALADDVAHADRLADATAALGDDPSFALVRRALDDELGLARQRIAALLAVLYGEEAIGRIEFQLGQDAPRLHALAVEWLEATLTNDERAAIAVLDPSTPPPTADRLPPGPDGLARVLAELAVDPEGRWRRPWLSACALAATGALGLDADVLLAAARPIDEDHRHLLADAAALARRSSSS